MQAQNGQSRPVYEASLSDEETQKNKSREHRVFQFTAYAMFVVECGASLKECDISFSINNF